MAIRTTVSTQWTSVPDTDGVDGVYVKRDHDGSYDLWCRDECMTVNSHEDLRLLYDALSAALEDYEDQHGADSPATLGTWTSTNTQSGPASGGSLGSSSGSWPDSLGIRLPAACCASCAGPWRRG